MVLSDSNTALAIGKVDQVNDFLFACYHKGYHFVIPEVGARVSAQGWHSAMPVSDHLSGFPGFAVVSRAFWSSVFVTLHLPRMNPETVSELLQVRQ